MYEDSEENNTYVGLFEGQVVDNLDPLVLGRVKFMIPGLVEPASDWTLPLGAPGAGSDARGFWCVPAVGSNVGVLFKEGDIQYARYLTGPWGAPTDTPESPTFVRTLSPTDATRVTGLETSKWNFVLDDRDGVERLQISHRKFPQNAITIDGVSQAVEIRGNVAVQIQSTGIVNIEALQVVINGRIVLPTGKPI